MRMKPVQCPTDLVRPSEFSIMHHESHVQPTWITQVIPKYWAQAMHKAASWCVFWEIFTNASAKSKSKTSADSGYTGWRDSSLQTSILARLHLRNTTSNALRIITAKEQCLQASLLLWFSRTYHEYENKVNPQKTSGLKMLLGRGELESLNNIFHILLIKLMNHNILR